VRVLIAAAQRHAARAAALASHLSAAGHDPMVVLAAPRRTPAFRKVGRFLDDPVHERAVTAEIRAKDPDVVHVIGCGGGTSVHLTWIARALGVPCTLEVEAAEALCHRGDLVHASGAPCTVVDDPERCAACCATATPGRAGPGAFAAALARVTGRLGFALTPAPLALRNRCDAIAGALVDAHAIVVADDAARALLLAVAPAARVQVLPAPATAALVELWRTLR